MYTYHWIRKMRDSMTLLEKRCGFNPGIVFKERPEKTILDTDTNGVESSSPNPDYISDTDWNDLCEFVTAKIRSRIPEKHYHLISTVEQRDVVGMQEALYGPVAKDSLLIMAELEAEIRQRPLVSNAQIPIWIDHQLTMFKFLQELVKSKGKVGEAQLYIMREDDFAKLIADVAVPVTLVCNAWTAVRYHGGTTRAAENWAIDFDLLVCFTKRIADVAVPFTLVCNA